MSCKIIISNPGIFGPADAITGKIICIFDREERIRGITCQFRGREQVHWNERRGKHTVHYSGQNDCVVANTVFVEECTMAPGSYEYNFSFVLPSSNVPSSFQHQFGSIRYFVHAVVDRPFAFDYKDEVALHVVAPIILPLTTNRNRPISLEVNNEEWSCCVPKEPSTMEVQLERCAYVAGEVINFKVLIKNNSSSEIRSVAVELCKFVQLTAYSPSTRHKKEKVLLAITEGSGIAPGSSKSFKFRLKIPETVLLFNFNNCLLFTQWCSLRVKANYPMFHRNLVANMALNLGNVAIRSEQEQIPNISPTNNFVPVAQAPSVVYPPVAPSAPLANNGNNGIPESPPPSYDDVIQGSY